MKANTISSRFAGAFSTHLLVELGIAFELVDDRAHQRRGIDAVVNGIGDRLDRCHHGLAVIVERLKLGALLAFDQHADGAVGQLEQLQNGRDHAGIVQIVADRIVLARIELGDEKNFLIGFHRRFERGDRSLAPDEQRHDHVRKDDDVPQGQKGKRLVHQGS